MVGRTNVGGGNGGIVVAAWAYIGVTYPTGSVCTATNGTLTFTAEDTSGLYVFQIPQPTSTPEAWTVSCTDGTRNKSATVSLSSQYQVGTIVLSYGRLPAGYQEVEYLESSGTQYIDTGMTATFGSNYEYDLDFMLMSASSLYAGGIFYTSGTYAYNWLNFTSGGYNSSTTTHRFYYNWAQIPTNLSPGTPKTEANVRYVVRFLGSNKNAYLNDSAIGTIGAGGSSSPNLNPYLFGINGNNTVTNRGSVRIYSYVRKNSSTNEEYQHLVPCYRTSDDVAGMYDLVSGNFLTNAGTGTFAVGADV